MNRLAGVLLLVLALSALFIPGVELAGRPDSDYLIGSAWLGAAILLLCSPYAAYPMSVLVRWVAAILFVMGLAGPFIANLIDQSLGA